MLKRTIKNTTTMENKTGTPPKQQFLLAPANFESNKHSHCGYLYNFRFKICLGSHYHYH